MSNYKHGNWYCHAKNKAEAKEIIEHSLASGAIDNHRRWSFDCDIYGVFNGVVGTYEKGIKYTITELRQKFPLPGEQTTEWNGEGFPSDGDECEAYIYADTIGQGKIKAKWVDGHAGCKAIAGNGGYGCIFIQKNGVIHFIESKTHFRPIRTERERWVD